MGTIAVAPRERLNAERKFYTRMAYLLVAVVFLGFAPSFYLRGIVPPYPRPNPTLPWWVVLHGALFTIWMGIFVAQTQLIAGQQHKLHMTLGKASMILAILLLPVMYMTSAWEVVRADQPPMTDPLTWTIVPLSVILPFAILMYLGWKNRRRAQWHKRLLLSAAILVVMGPAIGRLPLAPPTRVGMTIILLLGPLLFIPLFIWDKRREGHVHPATWIGFWLSSIAVIAPLFVFWTGVNWAGIATKLPGVGS
ncbi:MAG TPA: hypothetical protein VFO96_11145 [Gemmatimonadales bacterium]|nr:hypothetical protein [Gemmatimonadales bacterium]